MIWDLDMDLSALLILLVLTVFGVKRRELPLRRNRAFEAMVASSWLVALTDIIASAMCSYPEYFPVWLLYGINELYYVLKVSSPVLFFYYCLLIESRYKFVSRLDKVLIAVPVTCTGIVILLSPALKFVFYISPDGTFHYGIGRNLILAVTVYYLLAAVVCVFKRWNSLKGEVRATILFYIAIVIAGNILQTYVTPHTQMISLCSTIGILALFLVYQNPDHYRDHTTDLFDYDGMIALKKEDLRYDRFRQMQVLVIDDYREMRQILGDAKMDQLLKQVGKAVRQYAYDGICFYIRNGRFMMLFTTEGRREEVREKLLDRFAKPFVVEKEEHFLSSGFFYGGGEVGHTSNVEELTLMLNLAADTIRGMGYGKVMEVSKEIREKAQFQARVAGALERALQENSLVVYYQPIYSTKQGRTTSAEALVRIIDPELGMLYPDSFIEIAEQNGSIFRLGHQVFEKTCEFIESHDMEALGLEYIEINLSPLQCMREQLAEELQQVLYRKRIDPKWINLEITESGHTDNRIMRQNVTELSNYGLTFSLDDYGTGYSNLINVLSLPLKIVKVDKSIVWSYFRDENPTLLHVLELFKDSNLEIVCEGVEDLEMARTLRDLGCDYEQGYYFSRPVSEEDFLNYLKDQKVL
ncbi:MAG: EAL domain-containing protein [Lachnospiraceae bacterium]|nr:EAL domain-containing protein [Lachnospiraceae bacterium]